jgi:hypothetical protein
MSCDKTECCCKCQHQTPLNCHPWNQSIGKGSISDRMGWVCLEFKEENIGVFSDTEHGMRELFEERESVSN